MNEIQLLRPDVVVVGSGIAGTSFAETLSQLSDQKIVCIEAGPIEHDLKFDKEFLSGEISRFSFGHAPIHKFRNSALGGSSNTWGGGLVPFEMDELKSTNAVGARYWPEDIVSNFATLNQKAIQLAGIQLDDYELLLQDSTISEAQQMLPGFKIRRVMYRRQGPKRFSPKAGKNIKVLANYIATEIVLDSSGSALLRMLRTSDRSELILSAPKIILAMGGLETTRLFLNSPGLLEIIPHPGQVGSFYSGHYTGLAGSYFRKSNSNSPELKEETWGPTLRTQQFYAKSQTANLASQVKITLPLAVNALEDLRVFDFKMASSLFRPGVQFINVDAGHNPNPDSNVGLSNKRDMFGIRRLAIQQRISGLDIKSINEVLEEFVFQATRAGDNALLGNEARRIANLRAKSHHLGTLRLTASGKNGIVDGNLKVLSVENLYVCGSAVFPTYSYANPSLMISSLAIRLAEHFSCY